ncbi:conserved hypothetical protein [Trichinella spiralis]|uniref:hypothetical protein n=1 Tax=Trichinella spiralis TaxID=6334 RepID=UPI0001EFD92F|nr:conserved hypothetical protein [Trichinella spiralis]
MRCSKMTRTFDVVLKSFDFRLLFIQCLIRLHFDCKEHTLIGSVFISTKSMPILESTKSFIFICIRNCHYAHAHTHINDQWAEINMLKFGVELALWENGLGQADEGKGKAAVFAADCS